MATTINSDSTDHDTAVMVAIESHGDDFVFEKVRRVIGSAVAIAKGFHWDCDPVCISFSL